MAHLIDPERPLNPAAFDETASRLPISELSDADRTSLRLLADQIATQAGADGLTYQAGVAETLRWLADGSTDSEPLAMVISATDAP